MNSDGDSDTDPIDLENRTLAGSEDEGVVEVEVGESAHGSESSTEDDKDTNQGKKPKAIPRKATPPSSPSKSRKATPPTSPARSSPQRNIRIPNRFPDSPASTRTQEGKNDSLTGSKRKAGPGAAS
jgi:hypothetical protein